MPHKCTNCGHTFADGSKEMLSGCPDCGGNKFQFQPSGSTPDETTPSESANANAETAGTSADDASSSADAASSSGAVGRAASTVKGWVGSNSPTDDQSTRSGNERANEAATNRPEKPESTGGATPATSPNSTSEPGTETEGSESNVETEQSVDTNAKQDVDTNEDRAQASARSEIVPEDELPEKPDHSDAEPADENQPSLDELREELNSQFESIKVVEPGQYELNLMELYERDEYIIALKENGRYVIQVPDSWTNSVDS